MYSIDEQTGWYLPEAAHPHTVFTEAGFELTYASIKGGEAPVDLGSIDATKDDEECVKFLESGVHKSTVALSTCNAADYDAVFYVGGFGTMWDFPDSPDVHKVTADMWTKGGVVGAVCHGPCALVNVKLEDGSYLVAGKKVAAFTNEEEDAVSRRDKVPFTCEDKFKEIGAEFVDGGAWACNVVVDGKLVTGQNPPSAKKAAEEIVALLK